jgi:hypothetical protein
MSRARLVAAAVALATLAAPAAADAAREALVAFDAATTPAQRAAILARAHATPVRPLLLPGAQVVAAPRGIDRTVRALARQRGVRWAQDNRPLPVEREPAPSTTTVATATTRAPTATSAAIFGPTFNDPLYPGSLLRRWFFKDPLRAQGQWGLRRIDVAKAWSALLGGRWGDSMVGAIDSGVDFGHEDLKGRLVTLYEDDPVVEEERRPPFVEYDGQPPVSQNPTSVNRSFPEPHGTATASVIAATADNKLGMVGVNPRATVLSIAAKEPATIVDAGMVLARQPQIRIVNWSQGVYAPTKSAPEATTPPAVAAMLRALAAADKLVVVAAGNHGKDVAGPVQAAPDALGKKRPDAAPDQYVFPCHERDRFPNVLCVAATDGSEGLASFSNYGEKEVQIAAPGDKIVVATFQSTSLLGVGRNKEEKDRLAAIARRPYRLGEGTSYAAPIVAGALSLLDACARTRLEAEMTPTKPYYLVLKEALEKHGTKREIRSLFGKRSKPLEHVTTWGGRLDVGMLFETYGKKCS